ncbi:hypothetical protein Pelo_7119 [Pelomyxa schiedti]|nr:hypothetical protein Pelo_7119 [Pelomyxa schiedti]
MVYCRYCDGLPTSLSVGITDTCNLWINSISETEFTAHRNLLEASEGAIPWDLYFERFRNVFCSDLTEINFTPPSLNEASTALLSVQFVKNAAVSTTVTTTSSHTCTSQTTLLHNGSPLVLTLNRINDRNLCASTIKELILGPSTLNYFPLVKLKLNSWKADFSTYNFFFGTPSLGTSSSERADIILLKGTPPVVSKVAIDFTPSSLPDQNEPYPAAKIVVPPKASKKLVTTKRKPGFSIVNPSTKRYRPGGAKISPSPNGKVLHNTENQPQSYD